MGISERSLYEYLKVLKELGAPIKFSRRIILITMRSTDSFKLLFNEGC